MQGTVTTALKTSKSATPRGRSSGAARQRSPLKLEKAALQAAYVKGFIDAEKASGSRWPAKLPQPGGEAGVARARRRAERRAWRMGQTSHPLRASEVAALLGESTDLVRRLAASGAIPATRTGGGHLRFLKSDVLAWQAKITGDVAPPHCAASAKAVG